MTRTLFAVEEEMNPVFTIRMIIGVALLGVLHAPAFAFSGCIAHGNPDTDFTWLLCPNGQKYERQYRYWGIWSEYYPVAPHTGACIWRNPRWECSDTKYTCTTSQCVKD